MSQPTPLSPTWPSFARQVIQFAVQGNDATRAAPPAEAGRPFSGVFVTLKKFGRLRGCMGTLDNANPLADTVRHAAETAALKDPRFPPVALGELPDLWVEVSILSEPQPMSDLAELELGKHGIIVRQGPRRGLFLPQVATEHNLDKETFLSRCAAEKAGLPPDAWKAPDAEVLLFTAEIHKEQESQDTA